MCCLKGGSGGSRTLADVKVLAKSLADRCRTSENAIASMWVCCRASARDSTVLRSFVRSSSGPTAYYFLVCRSPGSSARLAFLYSTCLFVTRNPTLTPVDLLQSIILSLLLMLLIESSFLYSYVRVQNSFIFLYVSAYY